MQDPNSGINNSNIQVNQSIKQQNFKVNAGRKYECIYKNFLRDIRQYYSKKFKNYLANKVQYSLNNLKSIKYAIFPFQIVEFVVNTFN